MHDDTVEPEDIHNQGCRNSKRQGPRATKLRTVAPNICEGLSMELASCTLLTTRTLKWLLDFWKSCVPLDIILVLSANTSLLRGM
jgi:hypothetical protein